MKKYKIIAKDMAKQMKRGLGEHSVLFNKKGAILQMQEQLRLVHRDGRLKSNFIYSHEYRQILQKCLDDHCKLPSPPQQINMIIRMED